MSAVGLSAALMEQAAARPDADALVLPGGERISYGALEADTARIAAGLEAVGLGRGKRAALLVPPGREFFPLVFGMLRAGTVPVVVDPGMGLAAAKACLEEAAPEGFLGIGKALLARRVSGLGGSGVRVTVAVGTRFGWGALTMDRLRAAGRGSTAPGPQPEDTAAVLFTSGSTGAPKGAVYTHANFAAQVERVRALTGIAPGDVDLPTFPLFALFDPTLGMTTVVPDMDPARPAAADPATLVRQMEDGGVTTMFGSPALLHNLVEHLLSTGHRLGRVRRVITAGAPVPPRLVEAARGVFAEGARILTPYGATEALPVCCNTGEEDFGDLARRTESGEGIFIGRPAPDTDVRRIRVSDDALAAWSDDLLAADDEVGEVVVRGPQVTRSYLGRPQADALAKIPDGDALWHRMGDLARVDGEGRLWSVGRKSQRVRTARGDLHTLVIERAADALEGVRRTALVGVGEPGAQLAVLCVETHPASCRTRFHWQGFVDRLRALPVVSDVDHILHRRTPLPVDTRHNAKIRREEVAAWAAKRLDRGKP